MHASMPPLYTAASALVKTCQPNAWRVRLGEDLPNFIFANGPGRIVTYNFKVCQESTWPERATRIKSGISCMYTGTEALPHVE